jgi:hypothetical protein
MSIHAMLPQQQPTPTAKIFLVNLNFQFQKVEEVGDWMKIVEKNI